MELQVVKKKKSKEKKHAQSKTIVCVCVCVSQHCETLKVHFQLLPCNVCVDQFVEASLERLCGCQCSQAKACNCDA